MDDITLSVSSSHLQSVVWSSCPLFMLPAVADQQRNGDLRLLLQRSHRGHAAQDGSVIVSVLWHCLGPSCVCIIVFLFLPVSTLLNLRLCESSSGKLVSVLELPGSLLIVPQATLGGRPKGRAMQYHQNISKEDGLRLYSAFVSMCAKELAAAAASADVTVKHGTYGNRQVLMLDTNGPYTHLMEFWGCPIVGVPPTSSPDLTRTCRGWFLTQSGRSYEFRLHTWDWTFLFICFFIFFAILDFFL